MNTPSETESGQNPPGNEEKYRLILEQAPLGIVISDAEENTLIVNKKFTLLTGYTIAEMPSVKAWWELAYPDRDYRNRIRQKWTAAISSAREAGSEVPPVECRVRCLDGNFRYFDISCFSTGQINIISFADITEHKKIEELLDEQLRFQKMIARISSDFVSVTSHNLGEKINTMLKEVGLFFEADRSYLFQFSADQKSMHNTHEWCNQGIPPNIRDFQNFPTELLPWLKNQVCNNQVVHIPDVDDLPSGASAEKAELSHHRIRSLLCIPILGRQQVTGFFGFDMLKNKKQWSGHQISFLKMLADTLADARIKADAENKLISAKEKAEESDRLKSAFLANVSHEIRTPMNAILGFLELLTQPGLAQDIRQRYIEIVNNSGQRLLKTINDIIEISKIESGQMEVLTTGFDLEEVMRYHRELFAPDAGAKGLQLILSDHLRGEKAMLRADRQKVESILTNLLNNAIKFTREGQVEFGNYLQNNSLVIYVRDTGIGIPENRQEAIFERFVQADLTFSRPHEGTGLGLSLVKAYTALLNGNIRVESAPGKGTAFYFSIPYRPVAGENSFGRDQDRVPGDTASRPRVLIAEDDDNSYRLLEFILRNEPLELLHTKNGEDTVRALREDPGIALVLMDIKMPGLDGLQATRQIREFNPEVPIIAQTAHALPGDEKKSLEAGCTHYLPKPIDRLKTLALIHQYIAKNQQP